MNITIRHATPDDTPELARLLTILGHPTPAEAVAARWDEWAACDSWALVACRADGTLAGVATLHRMRVLHRPQPVGRITALVVDTALQGTGVGRGLVAAAEEFLRGEACGLLEITSNSRLVDAHAFYEHLAYDRTGVRFAKYFTSPEPARAQTAGGAQPSG